MARILRFSKSVRAAKVAYIVISAALCAFGAVLLCIPNPSQRGIGIAVGCTMLAFGVIKLVGYFCGDLYRLAFQFDLAMGILLIALGLILLLRPEEMLDFLCAVLGFCVLTDGLFKVQTALDARRFGLRRWWLILSLAILTGVAGLLLILRPQESVRFLVLLLGLSLLAEGVLNLSVALLTVKAARGRRFPTSDTIEYDGKDW